MILNKVFKNRSKFNFFLGMISGVVGLIVVLFAIFLFQDWHNEKLWEAAIYSQEEPKEEKEIESSVSDRCGSELEDRHPPVTSNEDFYGEKTHFKFSPNKKYITFVQNVFEEYGCDWDKYWAVQLLDLENRTEKTLFVDDVRMSSYEWLDNNMIRVFHNAGTGIRAYINISVDRKEPLFSKDVREKETFWTLDEEYVQQVKDLEEARRIYYELSH